MYLLQQSLKNLAYKCSGSWLLINLLCLFEHTFQVHAFELDVSSPSQFFRQDAWNYKDVSFILTFLHIINLILHPILC